MSIEYKSDCFGLVLIWCSLSYAKLVQTESNTKRACSFLLPRCSLTYAKLVQTESNTKRACSFLLPRCSLTYAKLVQKLEKRYH